MDYLLRPFTPQDLLGRIAMILKQKKPLEIYPGQDGSVFVNGRLRVDYAHSMVMLNEKEIHLSRQDYRLLCLFTRNVGQVLTFDRVICEIWGERSPGDIIRMRTAVNSLRNKLGEELFYPTYVLTHRAMGGYYMPEVPSLWHHNVLYPRETTPII